MLHKEAGGSQVNPPASLYISSTYALDFLHKLKKEPHPAFDLRQIVPSPHAGRGWEWGVRDFCKKSTVQIHHDVR